jgi:hypothetical protein
MTMFTGALLVGTSDPRADSSRPAPYTRLIDAQHSPASLGNAFSEGRLNE